MKPKTPTPKRSLAIFLFLSCNNSCSQRAHLSQLPFKLLTHNKHAAYTHTHTTSHHISSHTRAHLGQAAALVLRVFTETEKNLRDCCSRTKTYKNRKRSCRAFWNLQPPCLSWSPLSTLRLHLLHTRTHTLLRIVRKRLTSSAIVAGVGVAVRDGSAVCVCVRVCVFGGCFVFFLPARFKFFCVSWFCGGVHDTVINISPITVSFILTVTVWMLNAV